MLIKRVLNIIASDGNICNICKGKYSFGFSMEAGCQILPSIVLSRDLTRDQGTTEVYFRSVLRNEQWKGRYRLRVLCRHCHLRSQSYTRQLFVCTKCMYTRSARHSLDIDGLVQQRCSPSALAMELHLFCIRPSIWHKDNSCMVCKTETQTRQLSN